MATEETKDRLRYADRLPNNVRTSRAPAYMKWMRYNINPPVWNADYSNNPFDMVEENRRKFKSCLEHQCGDYNKAACRLYTTNYCYGDLKKAMAADDAAGCEKWGTVGNLVRLGIKDLYNNTGDKAAKSGHVFRGMVLSEDDKKILPDRHEVLMAGVCIKFKE